MGARERGSRGAEEQGRIHLGTSAQKGERGSRRDRETRGQGEGERISSHFCNMRSGIAISGSFAS